MRRAVAWFVSFGLASCWLTACSGGRLDWAADDDAPNYGYLDFSLSGRFDPPAAALADQGFALFGDFGDLGGTGDSQALVRVPPRTDEPFEARLRTVLRSSNSHGHGCVVLSESPTGATFDGTFFDQRVIAYEGFDDCLDVAKSPFSLIYDATRDRISWELNWTPTAGIPASSHSYQQTGDLWRQSVGYDGPWRDIETVGAPPALEDPQAFWTGKVVVVVGRDVAKALRMFYFDMAQGRWSAVKAEGMPAPSGDYRGIWLEGEKRLAVVTSGGGALLDPETDSWKVINPTGAPTIDRDGRNGSFVAVYGDGKIYMFGAAASAGTEDVAADLRGAAYDLTSETWMPIAMAAAPKSRQYLDATWTSVGILVWADGLTFFHPSGDGWRPVASNNPYAYAEGRDPLAVVAHLIPGQDEVLVQPYGLISGVEGETTNQNLPTDSQSFDLATREWSSTYLSSSPRRIAPVPYGTRWLLTYSGTLASEYRSTAADDVVTYEKDGVVFDRDTRRSYKLPASPSAPTPRNGAAMVMAGERLFVWGGCDMEYGDGSCANRRNDGKTVRLLLP